MTRVNSGQPGKPFQLNVADYDDTEFSVSVIDASDASVMTVLGADPTSGDGRSQWVWLRFPSGDLVLATFPQGDTYTVTEGDHSA